MAHRIFISIFITGGLLAKCSVAHAQSLADSLIIKSLRAENDSSRKMITRVDKDVSVLKKIWLQQVQADYDKFTNAYFFIDAALGTANNLQSLISKESYRNKIISLNNPTSGDLGFNLEIEIQNALKPLIAKAKKTDTNKFQQVIHTFLQTGQKTTSLFPAGSIFTSILVLAGNLTLNEKSISKDDIDTFIKGIEKYFNQYEKLYRCNLTFNSDMQNLKARMLLIQEDIKSQAQDIILALNKKLKRQDLKVKTEELMLHYFDLKSIQEHQGSLSSCPVFPQDAVKGCKEIANNLQRVYRDYAELYNNNFREISSIISNTASFSNSVNQATLGRTIKELEMLYSESKTMDSENLRLKTLFERLELLQL